MLRKLTKLNIAEGSQRQRMCDTQQEKPHYQANLGRNGNDIDTWASEPDLTFRPWGWPPAQAPKCGIQVYYTAQRKSSHEFDNATRELSACQHNFFYLCKSWEVVHPSSSWEGMHTGFESCIQHALFRVLGNAACARLR